MEIPIGSQAPPGRAPTSLRVVLPARLPGPRLLLALLLVGVVVVVLAGTGYGYTPHDPEDVTSALAEDDLPSDDDALERSARRARARARTLAARVRRSGPSGIHIVVDQTHNRLYLKRGERVLREAVCSAGSGMVLREGEKGRTWVFDTPRGVFRVQTKVKNPVWRKPDWAFVEEGKPIPRNPAERLERGTLGEYALYLGDGYLIHGTLYERLLGRSVTHGCIRLGRDDLRAVYAATPIGTPVYIY